MTMNQTTASEEAPRHGPRLRVVEPGEGGRSLPYSREAEAGLLACLLLDGRETMAKCQSYRVRADWFYDPKHAVVFEQLERLYRANQPMELAVLAEELKAAKQLERVGGVAFLADITVAVPTTLQSAYFIERVRELAAMRAVIRECTAAVEKVHANTGGAEQLRAELELHQAWTARTLDVLAGGLTTMQEAADAAYKRIMDKLAGKPDKSRWVFTGLREFDERFGAFDANNEDWLVVVAAFQGGAKSSFMRQLLIHNLREGKTALVFLLETGVGKLLELLACTAANVPSSWLGTLPPDVAARFQKELDFFRGCLGKTLFVHDEVIPAETVVARIDDHARRHGEPDFVTVDHMHLLNALRPMAKREQEMGFIAKLLARCGKRHNRTIFALGQLNRSARADGKNLRPEPHHIRDSGEIEQAARRIVLLHTPDEDMRGVEQTRNQDQVMMELYQAKHNNGRTGFREFWFRRSITRFFDIGDSELGSLRSAAPAQAARPAGAGVTKDAFRKGVAP